MSFNGIVGNEEIKRYLTNSVLQNKISQSYLFSGTEGIGKLLIAKQFARMLLCLESQNHTANCECKSCKCFEGNNHPDYFVINEDGETIKIEQIREITSKVVEQPIVSERKVYIINDCDKMTVEAQNCLLKTLEEPPEFVVIILISSNESGILNTIKSRCMKIKFKNIPNEELKKYAVNELGYIDVTPNLLESFGGSIGKAKIQQENQEMYLGLERMINKFAVQDIISIMNEAKIIYDKENIYKILDYMIICMYSKKNENLRYINCIQAIDKCISRLKSNCNFDMTIDTMLFQICKELKD